MSENANVPFLNMQQKRKCIVSEGRRDPEKELGWNFSIPVNWTSRLGAYCITTVEFPAVREILLEGGNGTNRIRLQFRQCYRSINTPCTICEADCQQPSLHLKAKLEIQLFRAIDDDMNKSGSSPGIVKELKKGGKLHDIQDLVYHDNPDVCTPRLQREPSDH